MLLSLSTGSPGSWQVLRVSGRQAGEGSSTPAGQKMDKWGWASVLMWTEVNFTLKSAKAFRSTLSGYGSPADGWLKSAKASKSTLSGYGSPDGWLCCTVPLHCLLPLRRPPLLNYKLLAFWSLRGWEQPAQHLDIWTWLHPSN